MFEKFFYLKKNLNKILFQTNFLKKCLFLTKFLKKKKQNKVSLRQIKLFNKNKFYSK